MKDLTKMSKDELLAYIAMTTTSNAEVTVTDKGGVHIKHPKLVGVSKKGTLYKQGINLSKTATELLFLGEEVFNEIRTIVQGMDLKEDQIAMCEVAKAKFDAEQKAEAERKEAEERAKLLADARALANSNNA